MPITPDERASVARSVEHRTDAAYTHRAMDRAAEFIERHVANDPPGYRRHWMLVDAELLRREAVKPLPDDLLRRAMGQLSITANFQPDIDPLVIEHERGVSNALAAEIAAFLSDEGDPALDALLSAADSGGSGVDLADMTRDEIRKRLFRK